MPNKKAIRQAFKANPDGFGLAYNDGQRVIIRKGAMTFKEIKRMIHDIPNPYERDVMLHFRWATDGSICAGNCHPYPITDSEKKIKATYIETSMAISHNGIIFDVDDTWKGATTYKHNLAEKFTDTQKFIMKYLVGLGSRIKEVKIQKLIAFGTSSKFALLTPTGFHLIGQFGEPDEGCYYSNLGYKPIVPTATYVHPDYDDDFSDLSTPLKGKFDETKDTLRCDSCNDTADILYFRHGEKYCGTCCYIDGTGHRGTPVSIISQKQRLPGWSEVETP